MERPPRLLVFPLDLDESDVVIRVAKSLGLVVVGASSAMHDAGGRDVDDFVRLPFVTDPTFDQAFKSVVECHGITTVFAPHHGVWHHLAACGVPVSLCQPEPFAATWALYQPHQQWAIRLEQSRFAEAVATGSVKPPLSRSTYSALHHQFKTIPGQCDEEKLQALCDIARCLPLGDLLEVGSLYGRSAFALGFLAARHKVGSLICVDPWNTGELSDQGPAAAIFTSQLGTIDSHQIFQIFLSSIALLENVGYIRSISTTAKSIYDRASQAGYLESPELGKITLSGRLSLVHIDGNHRYDFVKSDVDAWAPCLAPGGWLLLDDYVWAFGDGPQKVGDELLNNLYFDQAFVSSDTLFLRRTNHPWRA